MKGGLAMTDNFFKLSFVASASAAALLAACGGGGDGGQGTLKVSLTDAPACGYDAVNVTVNKVRVHRSGSAGEGEGGWSDIVLNPSRKINLLDLTNGVLHDLGQVDLPAGRYTQVRLVLDPNNGNSLANSVVLSGTTTEISLDTPSAVQSGIKLIKGFDVVAGQQAELVLDFDACKSIVSKGNGNYALKPVVKIIPSTVNGIEGYIKAAVLSDKVMVTAQQNGEVVSATVPDPTTGKFFLARLEPGNYDVVITADNRATAVIAQVPVANATSKVSLSTSANPVDLQTSTVADISGTVTLSPASSTEEVAFVAAKQSFAAGPTVTVKYRGADVSNGGYKLEKLPAVAPQLGQYSTTLPIALTTQTTTTPGTGKYTVNASLSGYQSQPATIDISGGNMVQNFTLTK
jgi:hypothetical protein